MVEKFQLHWRTLKPLLVVPLLFIVGAVGYLLFTGDGGSDDGLVALRTDASPTSLDRGEQETNAIAAPDVDGAVVPLKTLTVESPDAETADGDATSSVPTSQTSADGDSSTTQPSTTQATSGTGQAPSTAQTTTTQPPTTIAETTVAPTTMADVGQPGVCQGDGEFELVFRDDFNGDSVGSAWRQYDSIGNNGFGLRRPSAFSLSDGQLYVTAEMQNGQLVSGGMAHKYDQTYGKYVFRVRTDVDPNLAMSGVVLTWPESQVHPRDGENNIYETLVHTADRVPFYSVIHKPFGQRGDQELLIHRADGSLFQTMTMEWRPDGITIIRQGEDSNDRETFVVAESELDLIPDNPHHVTIQLDAWKHQIQGTVQMVVDFIEVHTYCR